MFPSERLLTDLVSAGIDVKLHWFLMATGDARIAVIIETTRTLRSIGVGDTLREDGCICMIAKIQNAYGEKNMNVPSLLKMALMSVNNPTR